MTEPTRPRKIVYYPPPKEAVEAYTQEVCKVFEQKLGQGCGAKEMQEGLTAFMKLVVKAKTKYLNGEVNRKEKVT